MRWFIEQCLCDFAELTYYVGDIAYLLYTRFRCLIRHPSLTDLILWFIFILGVC